MKQCKKAGGERASWKKVWQDQVYSLRFMWRHSKSYLFLSALNMLICSAVGPAEVVLTGRLFRMLEDGCGFYDAALIVILIAILGALRPCWSMFYDTLLIPKSQQRLHVKIQGQFFEKVRTIELARYDDPEFYHDFILAMQNADSYATAAWGNISTLIGHALSLAAIVSVLAYVDLTAMLITLASAVFAMAITSRTQKLGFLKNVEMTPIGHREEYINRVFSQADYAKELRLTDLGDKLIADYDRNTDAYIEKTKYYGRRETIAELLDAVNSQGVRIAVIAWTLYRLLVTGSVTLGGFTVVVNANWQLREALVGVGRHLSGLPQQSLFMEKVRAFMAYTPKGRTGTLPTPRLRELEVKNVSFGYGGDAPVMHNVDLTIRRGEKIAVVGYNGAGKTTLVKLIMGLYQPDSGAILYNGTDIREFDTDSYRSRMAAVFQDYKIFAATVGENVLGDECTASDRATAERALHLAAFDEKLKALPRGIDTVLTREFDEDGTNLSGGEAQKIAIARVFARDCDLIIMDEPSAALDPIAEYTLNQHIAEYAADKTVIFISHRLSTTRHADRIYMLENGRIVEAGTHDELMAQDGQYAHMFRVQAKNYSLNS